MMEYFIKNESGRGDLISVCVDSTDKHKSSSEEYIKLPEYKVGQIVYHAFVDVDGDRHTATLNIKHIKVKAILFDEKTKAFKYTCSDDYDYFREELYRTAKEAFVSKEQFI